MRLCVHWTGAAKALSPLQQAYTGLTPMLMITYE